MRESPEISMCEVPRDVPRKLRGPIHDITMRMYIDTFVNRTVKLLCDFGLFYVTQ